MALGDVRGLTRRPPGEEPAFPALRRALPRWGLRQDAPLRLLSTSENRVFLAGSRPNRLILRVHRPGYRTEGEILSELAWLDALRLARAAPVPAPLETRCGERLPRLGEGRDRHLVCAFRFIEGAEPAGDRWALFCALGALAARLHRHAAKWTPRLGGPGSERGGAFTRRRWDAEAILGSRPIWGDWRAARGLDQAGRAVIGRAVARLEAQLLAYGTGPRRFGLIHADLRPANVLARPGGGLAAIDFDDCGFGWFFYDFAAAVSFAEDDPDLPELRRAWLAGYRTVAPVTGEDEAMLSAFVMLRRILLTAWIASRRGSPVADGFGEGFTAGTVRLAARFSEAAG